MCGTDGDEITDRALTAEAYITEFLAGNELHGSFRRDAYGDEINSY